MVLRYRNRYVSICILFLILSIVLPEEETSKKDDDGKDYLYNTDADPIVDYHPEAFHPERPSFLYGSKQPARVVEYYAPWCPHCRHFHDHYISFARQLTSIVDEFHLPSIKFYAVSCVANKQLCKQQEIHGYPRIKLYKQNDDSGNATAEVMYWKVHPFDVLRLLGMQVDREDLGLIANTLDKSANVRHKQEVNTKAIRTKADVYADAYLSFHYSLEHGIFMTTDSLTNTTQVTLRRWLELLQLSMPPTWKIQSLIEDILKQFEFATKSEENLLSIIKKYPPATKRWSESCTKGVSGMGYTCGLWELFHIMTVGVVEYNLMIGGGEENEVAIRTGEASEKLRNFIANFFGCEVCRINFLNAYDACAFDRCNRLLDHGAGELKDWMQLPLWLFETHNAVNVRLLHERAEREKNSASIAEEVAVKWPAIADCPVCWKPDGSWDEQAVYKYLRTEYWIDDFITSEYRKELGIDKGDKTMLTPKSMSTVQYLGWMAVIAVAGAWYYRKRQRHRSGKHKKVDDFAPFV